MHGLINRGLQGFITALYGAEKWNQISFDVGLDMDPFETMLQYDDLITEEMIDAICERAQQSRDSLLEDFGTYLVSEHCSKAVRKLLRLGGETYDEFLRSLEDAQERLHLALPELEVPLMQVQSQKDKEFILRTEYHKFDYGAVLLGLLRAMADDYGSLVTIEMRNAREADIDVNYYSISLFDDAEKIAA